MAGTELGTGYISIVAETNRIPGQLRQAFSGAGSVGEAAGRDAGGRMSGALGKALKIGAGTAAAAITGTLGVAITKASDASPPSTTHRANCPASAIQRSPPRRSWTRRSTPFEAPPTDSVTPPQSPLPLSPLASSPVQS